MGSSVCLPSVCLPSVCLYALCLYAPCLTYEWQAGSNFAQRQPSPSHSASWRTEIFQHFTKIITIFCVVRTTNLKDGVESVDHVPELLLLKCSESSIVVSSDERLHGAGLKVGHLEGVSQTLCVINQAGPIEQVNQTEKTAC